MIDNINIPLFETAGARRAASATRNPAVLQRKHFFFSPYSEPLLLLSEKEQFNQGARTQPLSFLFYRDNSKNKGVLFWSLTAKSDDSFPLNPLEVTCFKETNALLNGPNHESHS